MEIVVVAYCSQMSQMQSIDLCACVRVNEWVRACVSTDLSQSQLAIPVTLNDIPPAIAEMLDDEDQWEFNILELEAATSKRYGGRGNR